VACGSGYFTRKVKQLGASEIVGIDISEKMLELARESEVKNSLGIKYFNKDAIDFEKIKEFDLVVCTFLFHYAKTEKELNKMIKNCSLNLNSGGRMVAINLDPSNPLSHNKKIGSTVASKKDNIENGDQLLFKTYDDKGSEVTHFAIYHWTKDTYEKLFKKNGFNRVVWHEIKLTPEAIKKYGYDFWKDAMREKSIIIIECYK